MQSRAMSLVESIANVVVGFAVAVLAQMIVFPLLGIEASFEQNLGIGIAFTAVSLARSHALRRLFDGLSHRRFGRDTRAHGQSSTADRSGARPAPGSAR
jgi:hypothetical protein